MASPVHLLETCSFLDFKIPFLPVFSCIFIVISQSTCLATQSLLVTRHLNSSTQGLAVTVFSLCLHPLPRWSQLLLQLKYHLLLTQNSVQSSPLPVSLSLMDAQSYLIPLFNTTNRILLSLHRINYPVQSYKPYKLIKWYYHSYYSLYQTNRNSALDNLLPYNNITWLLTYLILNLLLLLLSHFSHVWLCVTP